MDPCFFTFTSPKGTVNTPFPEKVQLHKDEASEQEVQEVPEGRFGVSQLCRVMAKPVVQFDASNKPIPESGQAQGGYIIHWMNGPQQPRW